MTSISYHRYVDLRYLEPTIAPKALTLNADRSSKLLDPRLAGWAANFFPILFSNKDYRIFLGHGYHVERKQPIVTEAKRSSIDLAIRCGWTCEILERTSKRLDARHVKYKVLEKIGSHAYRLNTPGSIHNVFYIMLLCTTVCRR